MRTPWKRADRTLSRSFDESGWNCLGVLGLALGALLFPIPDVVAKVVSGVIVLLGLGLATLRRGVVLDGAARTWTTRVGPWRRQVVSLEKSRVVEITRQSETLRNSKGPSCVVDHYDVTLKGEMDVRVDRLDDAPDEARWLAEAVSRSLGVLYRDRTVEPTLEKKVGQLDEPLVERYRREGRPAPQPRQPETCRATCRDGPRGLEIRIPAAPLADLRSPLLGLAGMALVGGLFGLAASLSWPAFAAGGALVALPTSGVQLWRGWQANRMREHVLLSSQALLVDSNLYGRHEIPLSRLEELHLHRMGRDQGGRENQVEQHFRAGFLCARSDERTARFGGGLSLPELEYARDLLLQRMIRGH